jgi:hypothetical protein
MRAYEVHGVQCMQEAVDDPKYEPTNVYMTLGH